jgi:ADP-ribosylglycohydrolase
VELPAGSYSDDTQLRLAVCRCIRASGRFDVEVFSKIELPVFLSYELGAGRGTRAAAHGLEKRSVRWRSNFFDERSARYVDGGGNGAAMRIQPHVWAARGFHPDRYLPACLRDSVTTHGHERGILGAAFHAVSLGTTLRDGEVPAPPRWRDMARYLKRVSALVADDDELAGRWLPDWERAAGRGWETAARSAVAELENQLAEAANMADRSNGLSAEDTYAQLATKLGGLRPATRGSGTVSAVLALWLAWTSREQPARGLLTAANLSGSDTDTVASMAGALLGAVASEEPPGAIVDSDLHRREAERLERLGRGERVEDFPHPDPLQWNPPRSLSDALGTTGEGLAVAGLGSVSERGAVEPGQGAEQVGWQWVRTAFGQTLIIKRRLQLRPLPDHAVGRRRTTAQSRPAKQEALFRAPPTGGSAGLPSAVEDGVEMLARQKFEHVLMARLLTHYARGPEGPEKAAAFGRMVAEALRERDGLNRETDPRPARKHS